MDKTIPALLGVYTGGSIVTPVVDRTKIPILELDISFDLLPYITIPLADFLYTLGIFAATVAAVISVCSLYREIKRARQKKRRKEDEKR